MPFAGAQRLVTSIRLGHMRTCTFKPRCWCIASSATTGGRLRLSLSAMANASQRKEGRLFSVRGRLGRRNSYYSRVLELLDTCARLACRSCTICLGWGKISGIIRRSRSFGIRIRPTCRMREVPGCKSPCDIRRVIRPCAMICCYTRFRF